VRDGGLDIGIFGPSFVIDGNAAEEILADLVRVLDAVE
jgi:hypothetical protein